MTVWFMQSKFDVPKMYEADCVHSHPHNGAKSQMSQPHVPIRARNIKFFNSRDANERFFCVGCKEVMIEPFVIQTCGHNLCSSCVDVITQNGQREANCPGDGDGRGCCLFRKNRVRPDFGLRRDMKNIAIYCLSCSDEVTFGTLKTHKCSTIAKHAALGIGNGQPHADLVTASGATVEQLFHEVSLLRRRVQNLEGELVEQKQDNFRKQKEINEFRSSSCASCCTLGYELDSLKTQMASIGSQASISTKSTQTVNANIKKLNEAIAIQNVTLNDFDIRFQCLENSTYDGKLLWKISGFQEHMDKAKLGKTVSLFSQPFYTGPRGYKMCARVYLNGDGAGKGSHISLFLVLMRGTYDEVLQWPFSRKVTLGLKDIKGDGSKSIKETFLPSASSSSFRQPGSEMNVASGCPKFISHKQVYGGPYIKDNSIFLFVIVDTIDLEDAI